MWETWTDSGSWPGLGPALSIAGIQGLNQREEAPFSLSPLLPNKIQMNKSENKNKSDMVASLGSSSRHNPAKQMANVRRSSGQSSILCFTVVKHGDPQGLGDSHIPPKPHISCSPYSLSQLKSNGIILTEQVLSLAARMPTSHIKLPAWMRFPPLVPDAIFLRQALVGTGDGSSNLA